MEIVGEPYHEYNYDVLNILNKLVILRFMIIWIWYMIGKLNYMYYSINNKEPIIIEKLVDSN